MFCCTSLRDRKNKDKIEGMASWLILGGVLPLAVAVMKQNQLFILEHAAYLWAIAMGIVSLLVKRTSREWQLIIALGAIGFLAAAGISLNHTQFGALLWPLAVLVLLFKQYRHDMAKAKAPKTRRKKK